MEAPSEKAAMVIRNAFVMIPIHLKFGEVVVILTTDVFVKYRLFGLRHGR